MIGNSKYNSFLIDDLENIWFSLNEIFSFLKEKTFFITGGTGFFGKWLLESLLFANSELNFNCKVIILSRNPHQLLEQFPHFYNERFLFLKGDIINYEFPLDNIDYIIHAATSSNVELNKSNPILMLDTILSGTRRTLELAKAKKVKSFLLISSGAIYGKFNKDILKVTEDFIGGPNCLNELSAYGEGKRVAELLSLLYNKMHNVPTKIARCFAFVGPYLPLDQHFAIGNFIKNYLDNDTILVKGDGSAFRSYLYPSDLITWLFKILVSGSNGRAYNVGSECEISLAQLANKIASLHPNKLDVKIMLNSNKNQEVESYVPNTSRANLELHLIQKIDLSQSIIKTINFYRNSIK